MTNLFLNDSTSETILPVVSKSEVMYKVYIPKDLAHMFKKGEGFHSLTKGGEYKEVNTDQLDLFNVSE